MIGDLDLRIDCQQRNNRSNHARLEIGSSHFWRHQHRILAADIIAQPDHVNAQSDQMLRNDQVVVKGDVQHAVCACRVGDHVNHDLFVAAQGPGRLKDCRRGNADDPILVFVFADDLFDLRVQFYSGGIRRRVTLQGLILR